LLVLYAIAQEKIVTFLWHKVQHLFTLKNIRMGERYRY